MTVWGYTRVSTMEQQNGSSLDDQATTIRHAAGMKHQTVEEVFSDPGVSGGTPLNQRPGGKQLLAKIQPGDTLIVAKMDRLFRSTADALNTVDKLKQQNVGLILCDMGSEPVTENGVGRLFLTIMAAVAEFEKNRIQERTSEGKRAKVARGGLAGGSPPMGWCVEGQGRDAVLKVNPVEQEVVQAAQDGFLAGKSVSEIAKGLNEAGFRNRNGGEFQWVQVKRMLEAAPPGVR